MDNNNSPKRMIINSFYSVMIYVFNELYHPWDSLVLEVVYMQGYKVVSGNIDSFGNQVTTLKIVKRITFRIDKKKQITNSQVPT